MSETLKIDFKPMGMCHVTVSMGLESPPIRKGSRARKAYRYFRRMDRIEVRSRANPNLTMIRSMEFGGCVLDTMEHLEAIGIEFDDCGNWRDREGGLEWLCRMENAGKDNWHESPDQYPWNVAIARGFLPKFELWMGRPWVEWWPSEALNTEWKKRGPLG